MRHFAVLLVLLALVQWSAAYSPYVRPATPGYNSGYRSSSYTQSSASSSGASSTGTLLNSECCLLNSWAYRHMDEVRQIANRLRQEYNQMSAGSTTSYAAGTNLTPWNENIIQLTGMTSSELDAICRRMSEQLVTDMRKGQLSYATIAQPNYFQWRAAQWLEYQAANDSDLGQQQQQQLVDLGHYEPVDVSNYDEVKNYNYPTELKVIDGRTYVVHKNCTEASKTSGDGSFDNPLVSVVKRNRTIITTNTLPSFNSGYAGSNEFTSGSLVNANTRHPSYQGVYVQPAPSQSTTTITRKKTIYDWINENMEPSVVGYKPVVNVDNQWSGKLNSYNQPAVHIPVESSNSDVETFNTGSTVYGGGYQPSYTPGSTVTIRRFNKTVITNADGTNTVSGSEVNKKWVDGKLVYDTERPFGTWSVPRDEAWKREERERFFWFLTPGANTPERLLAWQRQQEERLLAMADRYQTTIEEIQAWHRKELERYNVLLLQYQKQSNDMKAWQRMERGRLDWLIHQNSVTREELERWQRENQDKLAQLARQYRISLEELKNWQLTELNRLYVYFNDQNNSMTVSQPSSDSLYVDEQARLEELIRQHNASIAQLHNSIKTDQQKLVELSQKYKGNVKDMEEWLKNELAKLGGIINEQRTEMTRITTWQNNERNRLEQMLKQHRGSVGDLEQQIENDRTYIQGLAAKYHVSIEELEKWQRAELERLQNEGQAKLDLDIKEWQARERENLKAIIQKNDLTLEEFQQAVISDRKRLEELAKTYKIQVAEVEEFFRQEIQKLQDQGLLKEVKEQLLLWQQQERERLQSLVQQHALTVSELEVKIKQDQTHLYNMANTYQVRVEEIEEWLKKELQRLQSEGLVKVDDLKEWQREERAEILKLLQANQLTVEEFELKLLADKQRLAELARNYNVQTTELEAWIRKEGERLQSAGLLQMQEQLNNWQKIERERLLSLINKNNLSIEELQDKIKKDQVHLYSLAHQHQVRVEEIEEWIKKEIKKLQDQGLLDMQQLKDWQTEWRGNLTDMVKERDFTVEEFHKWLLEDRARLQALAMQHNVQIEELEQWIKNEEQRFVSMGLLKPNEKLTDWQAVERRYLERITQQQYKSTEQLEQRLRQDRELLEQLARQYSVQVQEIEEWMKKELARLRDDGQLQIDNLTAWQIAERERLEALSKQNQNWSVEEFEAELRKDREHMQKMAFQYHTSVEEIENWIKQEVARLQQQGKLNIERLTAWQQQERARLLNLLQQQASITAEEFEQKVQNDRRFLVSLARQYHITVTEVENYVKQVIDELREKGKFELEKLKNWQLVERDYIKQVIAQYNNELSTKEYEQKLLADRAHLSQLADHYHITVQEVEQWMLAELQRLRKNSGEQLEQLAKWQREEAARLRQLIKQNQHMTFVEFEIELMKQRGRLQKLSEQYSLSVEEIENWLRQQLLNLRTTGEIEVENLTKWQETEQQYLIGNLLQEQDYEKLEEQLVRDRARLQQLATQYSVSVEQIEEWMQNEIKRLKNSGLIEVEQLSYWQQHERDRLADWLKQQHNQVTFEDFEQFIKRDKARLRQIAQDYRVTVEEVETWVQKEGARLQILGALQRPQNYVYHDEFEQSWLEENGNRYPVTTGSEESIWQTQTRAHLTAIAQVQPMTMASFEAYLIKERPRWEQFARQYHITVEEIETWLRQSAEELQQQGLIQGTITVEEWQIAEEAYIQNLLNERLRKQQKWSIEELERLLRNDRQHLQQVATQYHITIEQLLEWYKKELQRLLDQRRILSEYLVDWQRREKERIYNIVVRRPGITLAEIEYQLLNDKATLNRLADEYHVSLEELEYWIRNELKRLVNLGLVNDLSTSTNYNMWQQLERQRLRNIAAELTITEEELLTFIESDNAYQQQLARQYGCSLDQLAPFQRIEANVMQREGLFDRTKLMKLELWHQRERDRLYSLIKTQNFSLKNLRDWQARDAYIVELASKYGITVQAFKDWQLRAYDLMVRLAQHYQMTLNQLQDFRDKELRYIAYVMHKQSSTEAERIHWGASEAKRMAMLERKTGLSGEELLAWRRRLYLQCQGLLPFDFDFTAEGGHESGIGSTNRTALPQQIISKDRGDQPPNMYEENMDIDEPGLASNVAVIVPPSAAQRVEPTARPAYAAPNSGMQSGYRYSKKEYKFTVPVGGASAAASADATGSQASASIGLGSQYGGTHFNGMSTAALTSDAEQQQYADDLGQQQQLELGWNGKLQTDVELGQQQQLELGWNDKLQAELDLGQQQQVDLSWNGKLQSDVDLGQQQQVEHAWNGKLQTEVDLGQQQVQGENLSAYSAQQQQQEHYYHSGGSSSSGSYGYTQHASEKQIAATPATTEVLAETEATGFWSKVKQKTSSIFG